MVLFLKGEAALNNRNAFLFFLIGTLASAAVFAFMTWDTHARVDALTNADKLDENVVAGKRVWHENECNLCHTILGIGGYYAPDMTEAFTRVGAQGITLAVQQPEVLFKDSFRHMPNLGVSDEDTADLVAFLEWVSNIDNNEWPPQDQPDRQQKAQQRMQAGGLSLGATVFAQVCMGCHSIGGEGGSIGPPLDDIEQRYKAGTIAQYAAEPTSVNPNSQMPPQDQLSQEELQAVAEFLSQE